MSSDFVSFMGTLDTLSSGAGVAEDGEAYATIPAAVFAWLDLTGDWAGAVASLIGLVN